MDRITEVAKHPSPSEGDQGPCKKISKKVHISAEEAVLLAREDFREEAIECEESNEKWYLCSHDSKKVSNYGKDFAEFNPRKHRVFEGKAACKLCFEKRKYKLESIGRSGGSTSGLNRHLQSHHKNIHEELLGPKKAARKPSTN